jgi:hypothetical protein
MRWLMGAGRLVRLWQARVHRQNPCARQEDLLLLDVRLEGQSRASGESGHELL